MAKFELITQTEEIVSHIGPSGTNYVINRGVPFEATDGQDLEYFRSTRNKKRFREIGIIESAVNAVLPPSPPKTADELFKEELQKIEGLTDEAIDLIVEKYITKKNLEDELIEGNSLDESIPVDQRMILLKYINPGQEEKPLEVEEVSVEPEPEKKKSRKKKR